MEPRTYRGGAPKKIEEEAKTRLVKVLFNQNEYKRLMELKALTKSPDLSKFIRTVCLDKPMRMKPQLSTHQEKVLSLLREMRADILRIGINVNQSVKRINATTDYQNLQHEVNDMAQQLARFDKELGTLMATVEQDNPPNETAYGGTN